MEITKNNIKILVIDDEPEIHAVLGKCLTKEGYTVESSYNAEEAYNCIGNYRPDLIILDIMMPKISGIEVCNTLKSDPTTKNILILIVSAKDAQTDRLDGLAHGADDYVTKPFHLKSLLRKIEHMLEKKKIDEFEKAVY